MKRFLISFLLVVCLVPGSLFSAPAEPPPPPIAPDAQPAESSPVEEAILKAARSNLMETYPVPLFDVQVENLTLSDDGTFASAWLVPVQPETGEAIPTEPGLAFATWDGQNWNVTLPSDPGWAEILAAAPGEVLTGESQQTWLEMNKEIFAPEAVTQVLTGYLLPWEEGKTVWLSRSVAHDGSFASGNAHYSFDFFISKTMFNVHAAKAGTVWAFKDSVPNDDHSDVNFLVLQDTTTTPTTYQLYMHLAQNSIPQGLRVVGAPVAQGQWIGVADNTGQSTGHHLHFQVETEPYWQGYWGKSVDISFADVAINGGRPRVEIDKPYCDWPGDVCLVFQSSYVSGNVVHGPANLPRGDLFSPQTGSTLQSNILAISGWAADDTGLSSVQIKAYYNGKWQKIGPAFNTSPYSYSWDVCSSQVPDGPLSLSLEIRDLDGNQASGLPGLRHLVKQYDCGVPPPVCTPTADQVALFAGTDFSGECVTLGVGSYSGSTGLGAVGVNNAASIQVGGNILATLYDNEDLSGRGETFAQNDSQLSDNRIGSDSVSSLRVQGRSTSPLAPRLTWPANGDSNFNTDDTIVLVWEDAGGGTQFNVKLDGVDKGWQAGTAFHAGPLSSGSHSWQVKGRNASGESGWSETRTLTIQSISVSTTSRSTPFSDDMESGSNGWSKHNWDQTYAQNHSPGGAISWGYEPKDPPDNYNTGAPNAGQVTSPPVSIPASGTFYLRFWYLYETESAGLNWDRRWVQISADGGPFQDILQLSDDPPNTWLQSPALDLSAYRGKTIRVRFMLETLDAKDNAFKGWYVDDFSITSQAPTACSGSGEPNDTPASATAINKNSSTTGIICPGGDVDYFKFSGSAGDQLGISTEAQLIGSDLDTYLFLLDSDGKSILAANDDLAAGTRTDSYLTYRLTRSGTYYIKLRAWNHPSAGGETYSYTLHLVSDSQRPTVSITAPPGGTFLPNGQAAISVTASDPPTGGGLPAGISQVDFFWHSGDWLSSSWIYYGTDLNGEDGWSYNFDTTLIAEQRDIAFYVKAYDWAGNASYAAVWGLALDRTAPVSSINNLPDSQKSTAIRVQWTGSDNLSGIGHYELQIKKDSGSWQDWDNYIDGSLSETWVVVEKGHSYGFRLRAVDRLGNAEAFPSSAEDTISVPASICSAPDSWENDNVFSSGSSTGSLLTIQEHTFCNPQSGSGDLNDQDWVKVSLKANQMLIVTAHPLSGGAAAILRLYAADGTTLLSQSQAVGFNQVAQLMWQASANGSAYVQITHLDGNVAGDDVRYKLIIRNGYHRYLPLVTK